VMHLAGRTMLAAGFKQPVLQVGHIGLLKALVAGSHASLETWTSKIARRSPDDLAELIAAENVSDAAAKALLELVTGMADNHWVGSYIGSINAEFDCAANELLDLIDELGEKLEGDVSVYADAAVMPRFLYHSGILFAGFADGVAQALLHGGRYDAMMAAHGRDMPATGFSCDLWALLNAA